MTTIKVLIPSPQRRNESARRTVFLLGRKKHQEMTVVNINGVVNVAMGKVYGLFTKNLSTRITSNLLPVRNLTTSPLIPTTTNPMSQTWGSICQNQQRIVEECESISCQSSG